MNGQTQTSGGTARMTNQNFGRLQIAMEKTCEQWYCVTPATWKKEMQATRMKEESLAMARLVFPTLCSMLTRKRDDGRAEALLIALYGCETFDETAEM